MICNNCGIELKQESKFCTNCGQKVSGENVENTTLNMDKKPEENNSSENRQEGNTVGIQYQQTNNYGYDNFNLSQGGKSKLGAGLLGIFTGALGIHRFYLGYTTIGIIQIVLTVLGVVTCGITSFISMVWGLVEGILILCDSVIVTDNEGVPLSNVTRSKLSAGVLGIFAGSLGVHRFYLGYTTIGIIQIAVTVITCGIGSIWGFVEGILILCDTGITTTESGQPLDK